MATHVYRFTGEEPEYFPTLGKMLEPGDQVESESKLDHPRLEEATSSKGSSKKKEA